ncbi:MAG TPA: hypothetical protein VN428_03740 [Bryobacteraceae bacterium]|nr:hypothetical protein [Bryobacteraceae bacterium]
MKVLEAVARDGIAADEVSLSGPEKALERVRLRAWPLTIMVLIAIDRLGRKKLLMTASAAWAFRSPCSLIWLQRLVLLLAGRIPML